MAEQSTLLPHVQSGARALGIALSDRQLAQFDTLAHLLMVEANHFNLTAITDLDSIQVLHFVDSLTLVPIIATAQQDQRPVRVVDVGTGAGLPGLALAIVQPALDVTLVDSNGKKIAFVEGAIESLGLPNARAVKGRAEHLGRAVNFRGQFDVAVARAVAPVATLIELLVPLLRVGGQAIMMKSRPAADEELRASLPALRALDAEVEAEIPCEAAGLLRNRLLVIARKRGNTSDRYPRRVGIPHKRPISV